LNIDGASAGDTGVTTAGEVAGAVPDVEDAAGGKPALADAGTGTAATLLAGCSCELTRRRTSRSATVGGALTTLGRRRRSVAASRWVCC
jgi:hypothetical protein